MIVLYISSLLPTNKVSLFIFASFIIGIVLIETNYKVSLLFYFSSILLIFILPINKMFLLIYFSFFGIYGLLKYFIEKVDNIIIEYLMKVVYFVFVFFINFNFIKLYLAQFLNNLPVLFILIIVVTLLLLYDYLYGLIMKYYYIKIFKKRR